MTETENVSKKLIEDAENRKREILSEASGKSEAILKEAEDVIKTIMAKGKALAGETYEHEYNFLIAQFNSELNQKFLMEKIKIVDEVIKRIIEKLENISIDELQKPLLKFAGEINVKNAVYQIGKKEKRINDAVVSKIFGNKKIPKSGKEPNFEKGLKIIDERKEYYFSERNLIDPESEDTKMEISKLLFE
ncbi:MAG: V-type ATP synthase subunit E [Actinomycetota bacterium]|nr:V-type ATP synthase subunit E [Actinomycetota bacterium]